MRSYGQGLCLKRKKAHVKKLAHPTSEKDASKLDEDELKLKCK